MDNNKKKHNSLNLMKPLEATLFKQKKNSNKINRLDISKKCVDINFYFSTVTLTKKFNLDICRH